MRHLFHLVILVSVTTYIKFDFLFMFKKKFTWLSVVVVFDVIHGHLVITWLHLSIVAGGCI